MANVKKETKKNWKRDLRWFHLGKYDRTVLREWSFRDWALHIAYRMDLINEANSWHDFFDDGWDEGEIRKGAFLYDGFRLIRTTPLINFDGKDFVLISSIQFPNLFPLLHHREDSNLSIKPATVSDYYLHEYALHDDTMLYCREFFSTTEESEALRNGEISCTAFKRRARLKYQYRWEDLCIFADDTGGHQTPFKMVLNDPMCQHADNGARVMMLLDTQAADKQIHDDLDRVLKRIRRRVRTVKKVKIDLKSWIDIGLLPYMDLQFWSALKGTGRIETCIVQNLLFPDDPPSHVIPARTRVIFDGLMSGKQPHWKQLLAYASNPV